MSYDLRIYTIHRQDLSTLANKLNLTFNKNGEVFVLLFSEGQMIVNEEIKLEDEDIPLHISKELPGISYLIECNLESGNNDEKVIKKLMEVAKEIAKNGTGVVEDMQTSEIILPMGIKRVLPIEKTERFSIIKLSWWFNTVLGQEKIHRLLRIIEKTIPEALPRRYGLHEPPKEKYEALDSFEKYWIENINHSIVWYPTKPVVSASISIPKQIGPTRIGYRFGHFSISIDSAVLAMPGWETAIIRLFKHVSVVLCPFYGDIYLLNDYIRLKTGLHCDEKTEVHPIKSWWWNGVPRNPGIALVVGDPILQYLNIHREAIVLDNGCKIFVRNKEDENDTVYKGISIPSKLYQPKSKIFNVLNIKAYPKIWPFEGPKTT